MARYLQPGDFNRRIAFLARAAQDDGHGNKIASDLEVQFTLWAHLRYLKGGEGVLASRLENRQPVLVAVKVSSLSRQIGSDWQCEISGQRYAVKEMPRPAQNYSLLEFLVEATSTDG